MAPTSRPRVGWTATMRPGSELISRARMRRCRLPPESRRASVSIDGADDLVGVLEPLGLDPGHAAVDGPAVADGFAAIGLHDEVVGQRQVGRAAGAGAVLGHVRHARVDGFGDRTIGQLLTVDDDAAGALTQAGDDLGQLGLTVAGHTGEADDLPRADAQVDARRAPGSPRSLMAADAASSPARSRPVGPRPCRLPRAPRGRPSAAPGRAWSCPPPGRRQR